MGGTRNVVYYSLCIEGTRLSISNPKNLPAFVDTCLRAYLASIQYKLLVSCVEPEERVGTRVTL